MQPSLSESIDPGACAWFDEGDAFFAAALEAISAARTSVRLETYIFEDDSVGARFRDCLTEAAKRGVAVRVLVDGFGSLDLPLDYWDSMTAAGGAVRVFNPLRVGRFGVRNHRKVLVCDDEVAFVGGFNIGANYEGDGVRKGWRDIALRVSGPLAGVLGGTFDRLYAAASFRRKLFVRLRRSTVVPAVCACGVEVLLGGPGRGRRWLQRRLIADLAEARSVQIMAAYFLPPRRLRGALRRAAKRGGTVELLLPGQSDVPLSKLATESLYRRLLRSGVRIHEYQPQMLHGKLFIVDQAVYVGSANLDPRSLRLNYEVMLRIECAEIAAAARELFGAARRHCREVDRAAWRHEHSLWTRLKQRFAYLLMGRLDPWITLSQWRSLPD